MKTSPSAAAIKTRHLALDPSADLPREIAPSQSLVMFNEYANQVN